jgi:hypothetical protein
MKDLLVLAIDRAIELGQESFSFHEDVMRYHEPQLGKGDISVIAGKGLRSLEAQHKWLSAIRSAIKD